jgi:hypothetical protein
MPGPLDLPQRRQRVLVVISAETVLAARDDAQPTGEAYCELAMTGVIVASVPPLWRREVASFLRGILGRAPVAGGPAYEPHRAILGSLVLELESWAIRDREDEPEPTAADLREPAVVAREREAIRGFREWADGEHARHVAESHARADELAAEGDERHAAAMAVLDAPPSAPAPAQPPPEAVDADPDWLT